MMRLATADAAGGPVREVQHPSDSCPAVSWAERQQEQLRRIKVRVQERRLERAQRQSRLAVVAARLVLKRQSRSTPRGGAATTREMASSALAADGDPAGDGDPPIPVGGGLHACSSLVLSAVRS